MGTGRWSGGSRPGWCRDRLCGTTAAARGGQLSGPARAGPPFLAGREGLLTELDTRLTVSPGESGPCLVALFGLGGAGKTSLPLSMRTGIWPRSRCAGSSPLEPAVLVAEFAVLAAQLGAREIVDSRDPVAAVHAVLARQEAGWLTVFDNVPTGPRSSRSCRPLARAGC